MAQLAKSFHVRKRDRLNSSESMRMSTRLRTCPVGAWSLVNMGGEQTTHLHQIVTAVHDSDAAHGEDAVVDPLDNSELIPE